MSDFVFMEALAFLMDRGLLVSEATRQNIFGGLSSGYAFIVSNGEAECAIQGEGALIDFARSAGWMPSPEAREHMRRFNRWLDELLEGRRAAAEDVRGGEQ